MKKIIFLVITLVSISFIFTACSSDDNGGSSDELYIRFTADGEDFNYVDPASASSMNFTINGQNGNDNTQPSYSSVSLWFPLTVTTGTFNFSGSALSNGDYKLHFDSTSLNVEDWAAGGSVTVTSVTSDYVEGTFEGTIIEGTETITITNGEFRAYNI